MQETYSSELERSRLDQAKAIQEIRMETEEEIARLKDALEAQQGAVYDLPSRSETGAWKGDKTDVLEETSRKKEPMIVGASSPSLGQLVELSALQSRSQRFGIIWLHQQPGLPLFNNLW